MSTMVPPRAKGIAGCKLKGIALTRGVIKQYGCINPAKQRRVVCRHFEYHGGKRRARRCYPEEIKKEDASCKDRQLEKGARTR